MATIVRNAHARTLAPGLREQHAVDCLKSLAWPRARCTCTPSYNAWIRRDDGTSHRSHATRAEAEAWLTAARQAARHGDPLRVVTLADAVSAFSTRMIAGEPLRRSGASYRPATAAAYERALRLRVVPHQQRGAATPLGDRAIETIDDAALQSAIDAIVVRWGSAVADATCDAIRALFRDLVERGNLDRPPVFPSLPTRPVPAPCRPYTPAEIERLLVAARQEDERHHRSLIEPMIVLVLGSGASIRGAVRLTWGEHGLDLEQRQPVVRLDQPSRGGRRVIVVALAPTVAAVLRRHRQRLGAPADDTPVFPKTDGTTAVGHQLVHDALRRVARHAGIDRVSPAALRATGAASAAATSSERHASNPTEPQEARR